MLPSKDTVSYVLPELEGNSGVRGVELDNVRMKRQLGCLGLVQERKVSTDMWARSGKFRPIWFHQSQPEASLDQNSKMIQLGDRRALNRIKLTNQVEDETRVQMHVAADVTSSSLSISAGSTFTGICAPEH